MQNYKVPRYKLYKFDELVSDRDRFIWEVEKYIYEEYNTKEVYKQKISVLDRYIQKKLKEYGLFDAYNNDYLHQDYYLDTTIIKAIKIFDTEETYEENDHHKVWSNVEEELTNFICKYCIHTNVNAKDNFSRIYTEYKNRNLDEYLRYLFGDTQEITLWRIKKLQDILVINKKKK